MVLQVLKQDGGWVSSRWKLTYKTGWYGICKAIGFIYHCYDGVEILRDDVMIEGMDEDKVKEIQEGMRLTLRGVSRVIGVPMSITFHNQTQVVDVIVKQSTDEFKKTDYEKFSKSMGQYLDSIEINMNQ